MKTMAKLYDILLQNNSSKEIFILRGLEDTSDSNRYLSFDRVTLPPEMQDGEYSYYCIYNGRDDVVYEPNTSVLKTILHTDDGVVTLGDLKPFTGLLRVGNVDEKNVYDRDKNNKIFYYRKDR